MSQPTWTEVLAKLRRRYESAGLEHKSKLLDQAQELLSYHRKAAIRALKAPVVVPALILMRSDGLFKHVAICAVIAVVFYVTVFGWIQHRKTGPERAAPPSTPETQTDTNSVAPARSVR